MHYLKRQTGRDGEEAVSPVVGVMLMLVVTIIIAAVVSGFAGGLIGGGTPAAPTVSMDVKIVNTGSATGSGFFATVTGVSAPVQTHNLELNYCVDNDEQDQRLHDDKWREHIGLH